MDQTHALLAIAYKTPPLPPHIIGGYWSLTITGEAEQSKARARLIHGRETSMIKA